MNHWVINCFFKKGVTKQRRNFQMMADMQGKAPSKELILGVLGIDESMWNITDEKVDIIEKERVVRYECYLEKKTGIE